MHDKSCGFQLQAWLVEGADDHSIARDAQPSDLDDNSNAGASATKGNTSAEERYMLKTYRPIPLSFAMESNTGR